MSNTENISNTLSIHALLAAIYISRIYSSYIKIPVISYYNILLASALKSSSKKKYPINNKPSLTITVKRHKYPFKIPILSQSIYFLFLVITNISR